MTGPGPCPYCTLPTRLTEDTIEQWLHLKYSNTADKCAVQSSEAHQNIEHIVQLNLMQFSSEIVQLSCMQCSFAVV